MAWPLVCGALFGAWLAVQFAGPGAGSIVTAVVIGVAASLPAGALLGAVAVGSGTLVLRCAARYGPVSGRAAVRAVFAGVTGLAITSIAGLTLALIGVVGVALWPSAAVGGIACVAAFAYFPAGRAVLGATDR